MKHRARNALIVDWDFFFPIDPAWDWGHSETEFQITGIWPLRAVGLLEDLGLAELPTVQRDAPDGWPSFWAQFNFRDATPLYVAESNVDAYVALQAEYGRQLKSVGVYLFDQHHDCGYAFDQSARQIVERGAITCEDWMIAVGQAQGAKAGSPEPPPDLHVVYPNHQLGKPPWRRDPVPYYSNLDRRRAHQLPKSFLPLFDMVFVCRSGAWVPPWCDDEFVDFVEDCPVDGGTRWMTPQLPTKRDWDPDKFAEFREQYSTARDEVTVGRE